MRRDALPPNSQRAGCSCCASGLGLHPRVRAGACPGWGLHATRSLPRPPPADARSCTGGCDGRGRLAGGVGGRPRSGRARVRTAHVARAAPPDPHQNECGNGCQTDGSKNYFGNVIVNIKHGCDSHQFQTGKGRRSARCGSPRPERGRGRPRAVRVCARSYICILTNDFFARRRISSAITTHEGKRGFWVKP